MSSLKEQVNKTAMLLNDIKVALEDQGVDTSNMTPKDYANAIRGVVNNITIDNISLIPVLIFKYSENRPDRPDGGSGNPETGETLVPEGGYTDIGLDYNASNKSLTLGMSNAVFSSNGDLYKKGSTPIRISGRDGQDGKQGPEGLPGTVAGVTQFFNYPIFYRGTSDQPDTPWAEYDPIENELQIQNGGTETIERTDNAGVVYGQSYVKYNTANMPPATCTTPIRMTAESSAVTGNIRYYQLSTSRSTPAKGTSSGKKGTEEIDIAPTKTQPYLFCYDETVYGESRRTTSPVYLMATYTLGLLDIDIAYAVGQENTVKKRDGESDSEYNERFGKFGFTDSVEAISADKNKEKHPDDENFNYYPGLTERTTYLGCRETFEYNDHVEQFYRIISYYKAAEKAPVLYSAGVYSDLVYYTRNDEQCPYIFYPTGLYLDESENVITKTEDGKDVPVTDNDSPTDGKKYQYFFLKNSYENNEVFDSFYEAYLNKKGKKIDSFEAIYSDIGIFKSALVGKFVFDDKYMFSMFGKGFIDNNSSGTIKMEYTNFTDTKGKIWDDSEGKGKTREGVATAIDAAVHGAEADKKFIPGTLINAVTGESWFANGNTRFYYDGEGDLAGGAIGWRFEEGKEEPTLYIDGNVKIGTRAPEHVYDITLPPEESPRSFSEVITDLYDRDDSITTTITTLKEGVKTSISELNSKLDKKVEYGFYDYDPSLENYPQKDWHALDIEINHQFDIFVNKANQKVGVFADNSVDGNVSFVWNEITDPTEKELYLNMAASADAQDGSVTTFIGDDPSTAGTTSEEKSLHEGDLGLNTVTSELKVWYNIGGNWGWHLPDMLSGNEAYSKALENWDKKLSEYQSTVEDSIGELNDRLDGRVVNHFYSGTPTLDNYPAKNGYIDPEDLTKTKGDLPEGYSDGAYNHIGDTYTDISEGGSTSGWSGRGCLDQDDTIHGSDVAGDSTSYPDNGFHGHRVADSTAAALLAASKAQAAADGKTTTYLDKPVYYEVGDLWILNDAESLKCFRITNPSSEEKKSLFEIEPGIGCKYPMGTLLNCKVANATNNSPNYINDGDQSISYTQQQLFDKTVDEVNVTINGINASVVELNRGTDQMIQSYFGETWPGANTFDVDDNGVFDNPTGEKTLYSDHIGDTYTNILSYDPKIHYSNKSGRFEDYVEGKEFVKTYNNKYGGVEIKDASTLLALENAQKAQDTADGKRTTFIGNPTTTTFEDPKEGDIAIDGNVIWVYKDGIGNTVYDKEALLSTEIAEAIKEQSDKTILNNFIYDTALTEDVSECISGIKKQSGYSSDYESHIEDTITIIKSSSESNYPSYKIIAKNGSEPRVEQITDEKRLAALTQAAHSQEAIDGQIKTVFGVTSDADPKKGCPSGSYNDGDVCIVDGTHDGKTTSISFVYKNGAGTETSTTLEQQLNKDVVAVDTKITELKTSFEDGNKAHDGVINQYFGESDISVGKADRTFSEDNLGDTYTQRKTDGSFKTWVYTKSGNESIWQETESEGISMLAHDLDGKVSYYVSAPSKGTAGDLWKLDFDVLNSEGKIHFKKDQILIAKVNSDASRNNPLTQSDVNEIVAKGEPLESEKSETNLLANSGSILLGKSGTQVFILPILVSFGDTFTFNVESVEQISGQGSNLKLVDVTIFTDSDKTVYTQTLISYQTNTFSFTIDDESIVNAKLFVQIKNKNSMLSFRLTKISMVKGFVPMSVGKDYQEENNLTNILSVNNSFTANASSSSFYYKSSGFNVVAGEQYTFCVASMTQPCACALVKNDSSNTPIGIVDYTRTGQVFGGTITTTYSGFAHFLIGPRGGSSSITIKNLSLVRGSTPLMFGKSPKTDYDYLKDTFGTVSEVNGVSLSKAVAVKNGNNVTAILDGTGAYNETGAVVLATGVDTSASTLADGINNAKLKIFQSGSLTIGETTSNSSSGKYPVRLGYDGSGHLANGNISGNTSGTLTVTGTINANSGTFKGTLSGATGTFSGNLSASNTTFNKITLSGSSACTLYIDSYGLYSTASGRGSANIGAGCSGSMLGLIGPNGRQGCKAIDSAVPLIYADNGSSECATFYGKTRFSIDTNDSPIIIEKRTYNNNGTSNSVLAYTPMYLGGIKYYDNGNYSFDLDTGGYLNGLCYFLECSNDATLTVSSSRSVDGGSYNSSTGKYSRKIDKSYGYLVCYTNSQWTFARTR